MASPVPSSGAATDAGSPVLPAWWWIAAIGAALAALAGGLLFWRRRNATEAPPEIVRPVVGGNSQSVAPDDLLRYLKVEVDAVRLARSMMAATLTYRVTLSNRASDAIRNIKLEGDLASAHGQAPISEQLADALTALPALHELDHLGAGQRKSFTGEMRLELRNIRPIRQGNIPIYIPLVRLKASAAGAAAKAFTFVVGKSANVAGARLQPFRLDTPPQTFNEIDARPLG
ncbi:LPXTG cell wall anchor domain-containing protein [Erythrobacter sp. SDW2]|uniref:LPXTG cell wall anchor domain-containing protein n=1 Tax=Erythrobacter sp. SDW2 TaxID=2907154 RepID=UPI001F22C02D|nr:LPXTG cell wall anchor domain-containing protein [Erythrobacter sp. SDW2]UIP08293.1 LPXTG cell wall anchor domain-containing protein [Erythrobacter sp. SDW2]